MKDSLILIRHGRSCYNVRETKCLDSDLTDFGVTQAKIVGSYLKKIPQIYENIFYVSPFKRCLQTAQHIMEQGKFESCQFIINPTISEYLSPLHDLDVVVPNRKDEFPMFNWDLFQPLYKPESDKEFMNRIKDSYKNLDDKSVVISHGLSIVSLFLESQSLLDSMPKWDYSINNCSLTWVKDGVKRWYGRNLYHEYE